MKGRGTIVPSQEGIQNCDIRQNKFVAGLIGTLTFSGISSKFRTWDVLTYQDAANPCDPCCSCEPSSSAR